MENIVLQTHSINKQYKDTHALKNIDISLYKGHIYGFIGENGAGKTTLLRIITGLTFPTSGELVLFEKTNKQDLENARKLIGSTIETPSLYPAYTAEENLELRRKLVKNTDKDAVKKMLQLVGLTDCQTKKVKDFSMGMKQRLGIALSLMGNPQMLILDEPVNGLDPKGIADLRNILQKLNKEQNITILISSHILSELYLLATDYIMIHKGKIIDQMTHEELEAKCHKYISIQMEDASAGVKVLKTELGVDNFKIMKNETVHLYEYTQEVPAVAKALQKHNILVTHIALSEQTLEDYFLSVTGSDNNV